MSTVNTRERIMQAALKLFVERGYQKTSIGRIETEAGLVPRAGAFYRHFEGKQALLLEVARQYVSETPENFGLDQLTTYGDTRAELIAIALKYEEAMVRQQPYARLIEEVRLLEFGAELKDVLDRSMLDALSTWVATKPAAEGMSPREIAALLISVLGGWQYYLTMTRQGVPVAPVRDTLLDQWATHGATILDAPR